MFTEISKGTDLTKLTPEELQAGIELYQNEETVAAYRIHQDLIAYFGLLGLAAEGMVEIVEAIVGSTFVLKWHKNKL